MRYACARLGPDLGEEVTAETFLAAFGRRGHYDLSHPDARPWLYGIAIRQTYAEAADALGISVSAVRSRLNRIRTRVRKALGGANPADVKEESSHG